MGTFDAMLLLILTELSYCSRNEALIEDVLGR
jgi:hypothetical protein